jgi:hypothetical protein
MKNKSENMQTTAYEKKTFVKCKEVVDIETGEIYPVQMYDIEKADFNFHKVWIQNLIIGLDKLTTQSLKLALWLIDNSDSQNRIIFTQRKIAEVTKVSLSTVSCTIRILQESNFLRKIGHSVYQINPDIIYKGKHENRMGVCYKYNAKKV